MSGPRFFAIMLGVGAGLFLLRVLVGVVVGLVAAYASVRPDFACATGVLGYVVSPTVVDVLAFFVGGDKKKRKK